MLGAVLNEAKQKEVIVPNPYSFQIHENTLFVEMRPSVKVWVVQVYRKGDTNHVIIEAQVNPTNFEVDAFSSYSN